MSHIATVRVKLKNRPLLAEICGELGIPCDLGGAEIQLFATKVKAVANFRLPGWTYPVAVLEDGTVQYDNYNGAWGRTDELHRVLRAYSERITQRHARRIGASVRREEKEDGTVVLRLIA